MAKGHTKKDQVHNASSIQIGKIGVQTKNQVKKTHSNSSIVNKSSIDNKSILFDPPENKGEQSYPPYHFVPNPSLSIIDGVSPSLSEAVLHHQNHEGTFSGELFCELTTVTTAIFAGYQRKFSGNSELVTLKEKATALNHLIDPKKMTEKTVLYPLAFNGRTLIAGSSIKGMLRHSIAALASAPMLRVQEKTFSFRPNLGNAAANTTYKTYPAIVETVDLNNEILKVKILDNINIKDDLSFKVELPDPIPQNTLRYKGGTDGDWALANAFECAHTKKNTVTINNPKKISNISTTNIGRKEQQLYHLTTEHLCDTQGGHISSRHPLALDTKTLANAIRKNRTLEANQLIFVEAQKIGSDYKVISYGNNYYYHWRYKDSLRTINVNNGSKLFTELRPETSLLKEEKNTAYTYDEEKKEYKPSELNVVRSLFGFVSEQESNINNSADNADNKRQVNSAAQYAGRISVNHAIEKLDQKKKSVLEGNKWVVLPTAGMPRASAVEFYVQQNKNATDKMNTYGDSAQDQNSQLNGRKFYPHHDGSEATYLKSDDTAEKVGNKLAPLASGVVPQNTKYRFSIRFRALKDWELGMLLVAISPQLIIRKFDESSLNNLTKSIEWINSKLGKKAIMGVKLGYGRPFGFGSCFIEVAQVKEKDITLNQKTQESCIDAFLKRFNVEAFDDVLLQWLKLHDLKTSKYFTYPDADKKNGTLKFHSGIRTHHLKHRRNSGPGEKKHGSAYLPDLDKKGGI